MSLRLDRCYDSHLHFEATGEFQSRLSLSSVGVVKDFENLKPLPSHFRQDWLFGFGLQLSLFTETDLKYLDLVFSDIPIYFQSADAHAVVLNSAALRKLQLPTGKMIFKDQEKEKIDPLVPAASYQQRKDWILKAQNFLHSKGFTHARDMTWDQTQIQIFLELEKSKQLQMFVEGYFWLHSYADFQSAAEAIHQLRKENSQKLRGLGVKIFYDGALGSEGALLSECYHHSAHHGLSPAHKGLRLWNPEDLAQTLLAAWRADLEVAVHTIGDQAIFEVAQLAAGLSLDHPKKITFEHGELIQPKTFPFLQKLGAKVYMQPCHFLSDQEWLERKIGPLVQYAFPWAQLEENQIPFFWGSDSPIEEADVFRNILALGAAEKAGIKCIQQDPLVFHQHPDKSWGANCFTRFQDQKAVEVFVEGLQVFKS